MSYDDEELKDGFPGIMASMDEDGSNIDLDEPLDPLEHEDGLSFGEEEEESFN